MSTPKTAATAIAAAVANGTVITAAVPTPDAMAILMAKIAELEAANARLKAAKPAGRLSLKVSAKGGVSVYGLGRFPVSLYGSQWERLLAAAPEIQAFLKDNAALLANKSDVKAEVPAVP